MINVVINIIMISYFLIRIIRNNPIQIIQTKLDIYVILFVIATTIPLISNTYISLYTTVLSVLNYTTLLWIYILIREIRKLIKNFSISNNIKNIIYGIINTLIIIGVFLTYSKTIYIIFFSLSIIYIIYLICKVKNYYIVSNVILSFIISFIFIFIFEKMNNEGNYIGTIIISIFSIIITGVLHLLNIKITKYYENIKIKRKTIIALSIVTLIICMIFLTLIINKPKEFIVFSNNSVNMYNAKIINNIEPNKKYIFSFNMDAKVYMEEEINDMFTINIIQKDVNNIEITNKEESFGDFSGTKEIKIETTNNTSEIKIEFIKKHKYIISEWTIDQLKINEKEYILEYKYLPTKLVEVFTNAKLQDQNTQEKIQTIKDGLKIIYQNPLTGFGGGSWQYKYEEVQEYGYTSEKIYSYFIKVWLEFGILSIVCLIRIIILSFDKTNRKIKIQKNLKRDYCTTGILISISITVICLYLNPNIYDKSLEVKELETLKTECQINSEEYRKINYNIINAYNNLIKYERDEFSNNEYEVKIIQAYIESGEKEIENIIEDYYKKIINYKNKCQYNATKIVQKSSKIVNVINILKEQNNPQLEQWITKLAKINIDEFEESRNQLQVASLKKYKYFYEDDNYKKLLYNCNYSVEMYEKYKNEIIEK